MSSTMFESISTSSTFSTKRLKNITESGTFFFGGSSLRISPNEGYDSQITPVKVSLDDLDDLIAALSPEELTELSEVDPDDSSMPPSMRCVYKCEKKSSGTLNRDAMLKDLKDHAMNVPDKEEKVQFVPGTIRGKTFIPKTSTPAPEEDSKRFSDDEEEAKAQEEEEEPVIDQEYITALENATLQEIVEIADILGITFQDHCQATVLKTYPLSAPNDTNIDKVLQLVQDNSPELIEVNFNNIKGISKDYWKRFFGALSLNKVVESLSAANCDITDTVGSMICKCLEGNSTLKALTLDSNMISGDKFLEIIKATGVNKTLEELRVSHQLNCKYLGHQTESDIAQALHGTPNLVKLGVTMEFRDSLNKTAVALQKNLDQRRLTEDRSVTLKLDKTKGPQLVDEK